MKKYFVAIRKDSVCMLGLPDVLAQENGGCCVIECRLVDIVSRPFVVLSEIPIVDGGKIPEVYVPVTDVGIVVWLDSHDQLPMGFRSREQDTLIGSRRCCYSSKSIFRLSIPLTRSGIKNSGNLIFTCAGIPRYNQF